MIFLIVTFWVSDTCNLECKYCYVKKDKLNEKMSLSTAKEAVKYTISKFDKSNDNRLLVGFHGGEPLLNIDIIKYIINELNEKYQAQNKEIIYGMTTNGTLIDDNNMEYIVKNIPELSISIDGTAETHNKMRPFKNGLPTHHIVIKKAIQLKTYIPNLRIRMTFDSTTIGTLYEDVKYLIDRGFKFVVPAPNNFDDGWNENHMKILKAQLIKIKNLLQDSYYKNKQTEVSMLDGSYVKKGKCLGGVTSFHISVDGYIYPCILTVGDKRFSIGHVKTGIEEKKIDKILNLSDLENKVCIGCALYEYCDGVRCKLLNKIFTGDYVKPSPVNCAIENIRYELNVLCK